MNRCMIVDDSQAIRKVARAIFEGLRFEVAEAESADEALKLCDEQMPDLIILDWIMSGMSAVDFILALRSRKSTTRARIIYLTSELDIGDITRAINAGADSYLMKPFNRKMVVDKVADIYAHA